MLEQTVLTEVSEVEIEPQTTNLNFGVRATLDDRLTGVQIGGLAVSKYFPPTYREFVSEDDKTGEIQWGPETTGPHAKGWQIGGVTFATDLFGLQTGLVNGSLQQGGVQLGFVNGAVGQAGIQAGGINYCGLAQLGLQAGIVNYVGGFSLGPIQDLAGWGEFLGQQNGIQLGAINAAQAVKGVQFGLGNLVDYLIGVQVGLICIAGEGKYIQIGLVNIRRGEGPWYTRISPLFGYRKSAEERIPEVLLNKSDA